ncbi:MAG: choice-of-anchor D domain-containing protein [Betaproteobacteria bacterium]|nr:choice-of-anchor D domain-containing protein [Betaproteobacteria bacterium]
MISIRRLLGTKIFAAAISLAGLFAVPGEAGAVAGCNWVGASGQSWDVASNWSCGRIPLSSDDVVIAAGTVQLGSAVYSINSLTLQTNGSITGLGILSSTIVVNGAFPLQFGSSTVLTAMTLVGPPINIVASPASAVTQLAGVEFTISPGGTLSANLQLDSASTLFNDGTVAANISGTGIFINRALIDSGPTIATTLSNQGIMRGTIALASAANLSNPSGVIGDSSIATSITAPGNLALGGGFVVGNVTFNVSTLTNNAALIAPGAAGAIGTVTVNGDFVQGPGGTLAMDVFGQAGGQFDQLLVSGTASLGGHLISNIDSEFFTPVVGNTFNLITHAGATGSFAMVLDDNNYGVSVNYLTNQTQLLITAQQPIVCQFIPASGQWNVAANWGGGCAMTTVPGANDRAEITGKTAILPAGTTQIGDLYLGASVIQGAGRTSSTLQVGKAGGIAWGSGSYTFQTMRMTITTVSPLFAISGTTTLDDTAIVVNAGSTVNFAQISAINCTSFYVFNNGTFNLTGDVTAAAPPCEFYNASSGVLQNSAPVQLSGMLENEGVILPGGSVNVLTLASPANFQQTSSGAVIKGFGTLAASSALTIGGGEIGGYVTFNVPTLNNTGAVVRPGGSGAIGNILVTGNYIAGAGATHEFEFTKSYDGETHSIRSDYLQINGVASVFAGSLNVPFITTSDGPSTPAILAQGSSRVLISHQGASGTFANFTYTPGRTETLAYNPNNVAMLSGPISFIFTVTSTADSGPGTLRDAINNINLNSQSCGGQQTFFAAPGNGGNGGPIVHTATAAPVYTINFAVGTGVIGIQPQSQLPAIACPTLIDGTTQPGSTVNSTSGQFNATVNVILNGVNCVECNGLSIDSNNTVVKGLSIINWSGVGIDMTGNASDSALFGNLIGLDAGGNAHGNGYGIMIENGPFNVLVGDSTPAGLNVISGNATQGIFVDGSSTSGVILGGNLIGLGTNGSTSIGNGNSGYGITVKDANGIQIGNSSIDGGGAGPAGKGVAVIGSAGGVSILNTGIYNATIGIDLNNDGPTPNDAGDVDTGPNGLQNYPVITGVTYLAGGITTVTGTLNSASLGNYRLEMFTSSPYSSNRQGQLPSGQLVVALDMAGNTNWTMTTPGPFVNPSMTATDNASNSTSEFSPMHYTPFSYVVPAAFNTLNNVAQTRNVTLTNLTNQAVTVGSTSFQSGANFSVTGNTCTAVAPAANCTITVQFLSTTPITTSDTLSVFVLAATNTHIVSDAIYQFPLSAVATSGGPPTPTTISTSTPGLNFGQVLTGTAASPTQLITLTNTGANPLIVTGVTLSGVAAGEYSQTNTCASPVAPTMTCAITVGFTPAVNGARSAQVNIASNATGSPHVVTLTGTGLARPVVSLAISPVAVVIGGSVTATMTLSNANAFVLTANGFTYNHIPGLVNAAVPGVSSTCPGAGPTAAAGAGTIVQASSFTIPAGGSCSFSVNVTASAAGSYSGSVAAGLIVTPPTSNVASNQVTLTVAPPNSPAVTLTPASLQFGSQGIGTTSAAKTVVVTNSGNAALTITRISSIGDFAFVSNCPLAPATLGTGATCKIDVIYSPLVGGPENAFVYIDDNAPVNPQAIPVGGQGIQIPLPAIAVSPSSLAFGDRVVASTSATQIITVNNAGLADLSLSSVVLSGAGFVRTTIAPAGVTIPSCGSTVPAQSSCFIGIVFAPSATGAVSGDVAISHNVLPTAAVPVANPVHVTLSGNGTPIPAPVIQLSSAPAFGNVIVGNSATQGVTMTNTGTAALAVSAVTLSGLNASEYSLSGNCVTSLNPGANCAFNVQFAPLSLGAKVASVNIASNAQNATAGVNSLALTGTGVPVPKPVMQLSATTLGFGNVIYGSSFSQGTGFSNSGTAAMQILGIDTSGNSDFTVTQSCGTSLAAGGQCRLTVNFAPHALGARSGTVNIRTNADGSPHHIQISGTGCRYFSPAAARFFLTSC